MPLTPDRLSSIRSRLAAVEDGHPWEYEPKHEMFVGSTNAVVMYYRVIDLGRTDQEYSPTPRGRERDAKIRALGEFLESVREDMRVLLEAVENAEQRAWDLQVCLDMREAEL